MIHTDLHMHSTYSDDGEFEVIDLVKKCQEQKIETFSLTDHNSVKGIGQAIAGARQAGIGFVPGIEMDCHYEGTNLHLLGYHIDWTSSDFLHLEEAVASQVMDSFGDMIGNLHRLGFKIEAEAVLTRAAGRLPSGELIAEVMLADEKYASAPLAPYKQGGTRSDMPYINFYLDYFAQGRPAHVPLRYIPFEQAVAMVKENGGTPIVAHPGLNLKGRESVAEQLLDRGAEGLEVFNNYHTPEQSAYFASLVQHRKRFMTCGSDFHGKTKPLIHVGQFPFDSRHEGYPLQIHPLKRNEP